MSRVIERYNIRAVMPIMDQIMIFKNRYLNVAREAKITLE